MAGRELSEALRRKSFWAVVALLLAGSAAAMVIPEMLDESGSTTRYEVVVVGEVTSLEDALGDLGAGLDARIDVETVDDVAAAEQRVEDDQSDVGVVPGDDPRIIVKADAQEDQVLVGAVRQALATDALAVRLAEAGLSEREVQDVFALPSPRLLEVDQERTDRRGASFALSLVLYLLLMTLMVQVANGTAVEKSNRISEVLLPIVRPGPLLFGKVLGVGLAGLFTLSAGIAPVVVKLALGGDLPEGIGGALAGSAAWFVLGLALYLILAGALGALVERQEETGSVMTALTASLIGTFLVAQTAPESTLGTVFAYVPFTSPLLIPTRLAIGVSNPLELVASLVLLGLAIVVVGRFGAAIYARAIVRTGRRLKLREVLPGS